MIHSFNKIDDFFKMVNLFSKTDDLIKSEKIRAFPLVCSKYLSSWTGLGRSGHVRFPAFGRILHVLPPKLSFGPETCEICPKVLRKVYGKCTESPRLVQEDP